MNTPFGSANTVALELQKHYAAALPPLIQHGMQLVRSLLPRQPPIAQLAFISITDRMFTLFCDAADTFQTQIDTGYYASATLTRGLFETVTQVAILTRNPNAAVVSALLASAEASARRRRDGLAKMCSAHDSQVAAFARKQTGLADRDLQSLQTLRSQAMLPPASAPFPDMLARCKALGELWECLYHAVYRGLSETVHGSFQTIPTSPALAEVTSNQKGALIHEHCRIFAYAFSFWESGIRECCVIHPDCAIAAKFQELADPVIAREASLLASFPPSSHRIAIYF